PPRKRTWGIVVRLSACGRPCPRRNPVQTPREGLARGPCRPSSLSGWPAATHEGAPSPKGATFSRSFGGVDETAGPRDSLPYPRGERRFEERLLGRPAAFSTSRRCLPRSGRGGCPLLLPAKVVERLGHPIGDLRSGDQLQKSQ